jgi:hypothetical protein
MDLYRSVRDRREIDIRFVLGRIALNGTGGIPKNPPLRNIGCRSPPSADRIRLKSYSQTLRPGLLFLMPNDLPRLDDLCQNRRHILKPVPVADARHFSTASP